MTIKASTQYTKEATRKLAQFSAAKTSGQIVVYVITELVMLFMSLLLILTAENRIQWAASVFLLAPLFLLLTPLIVILMPRLTSNMSKNLWGCINQYEFTDEEIVVNSVMPTMNGQSRLNYNALDHIYETQDCFYIFLTKQQAFIANKPDITEGSVEELQELLKAKMLPLGKYTVKTKGKKLVPVFAAVIAVVVAIAAVYSYLNPYSTEKVFAKAGFTITLTEGFQERTDISFTNIYESQEIGIYTIKEELSYFEGLDFTLEDYAELIMEVNEIDSRVETHEGLTAFLYDSEERGKKYQWVAVVYQGSDAYWFVQFVCDREDFAKLEPTIWRYAKSVVVD